MEEETDAVANRKLKILLRSPPERKNGLHEMFPLVFQQIFTQKEANRSQ